MVNGVVPDERTSRVMGQAMAGRVGVSAARALGGTPGRPSIHFARASLADRYSLHPRGETLVEPQMSPLETKTEKKGMKKKTKKKKQKK